MAAHGATLAWDRSVTDNVDAEVRAGGRDRRGIDVAPATLACSATPSIDDVSSRDERLDGDQWLLGKSMPGFCPVGPSVVTADELDPARPAPRLHGQRRADPGRHDRRRCGSRSPRSSRSSAGTSTLRPGDLIATGTPARLTTPPGPGRRLRPGDRVTCWIEGIGELTTHIADRRGGDAMKPPTVFLGEMTSPEVEAFLADHETVIVPVGSTEQHGPHGPLLTDAIIPTRSPAAPRRGSAPSWRRR